MSDLSHNTPSPPRPAAVPPITDPLSYAGLALKSSSIVGTNVVNLDNQNVGKVEEVVIDVNTGQVAYLVLSFGGFLGVGEKLYAVPWKALHYDRQLEAYVLNVSRQQIENAPGFEKEVWPPLADEAWNRRIHDYYDIPPYWGI